MREEATDAELIQAVLAGREDAFDLLMKRYQRFVYKLAFGFARSHEHALDLTQTVFLKVYTKISSFRGQSSFKTWLAKVTYNEGITWQRANRRHSEGHEELAELPTTAPSQDDQLLRKERLELVLAGLERLNRRYRTAIELRYFHGMPPREIAGVLGCSEGVAKNALFRGVRHLRSHLARA